MNVDTEISGLKLSPMPHSLHDPESAKEHTQKRDGLIHVGDTEDPKVGPQVHRRPPGG